MLKRFAVAVGALAVLTIGIGTAQAKPDRLLATPANVCRALVDIRPDLYSSYGECVGRLNKDVAAFRAPNAPGGPPISIDERCTELEAGVFGPPLGQVIQVTYPFFFEEPPGWPFPEYWAQNHNQCENTLYAYHRFVGA
jgi:hypothetical protein